MFHCDRCGKSFSRKDNMRRHQMQSCRPDNDAGPPAKRPRVDSAQPSAVQELCNYCNRMVPVNRMNSHLKTLEHRTNSCTEFEDGVKIINSAFKYRIVSYRVESKNPHSDYQSFFNEVRHKVVTLIDRMVQVHNILKVNMELFGRYVLQTQEILEVKSFNSQNQIVDQSNNLEEVYRTFVDTLSAKAVEFQERDSGWTLEKVVFIEVNINKYSPLSGSSYIKLPEFIALKRAVVNVRNEDHFCFAWAVTSALRPAQTRTSEVGSYPDFRDVLNVEGIDFPMKLRDIPQFENMNDCSVNVYGLETTFENNKPKYEIVGPLYYARRKLGRHVNLLNITDESSNSHYCWIKDLSRLVSSQISSHGHRMYFCDGCLMYFSDERKLLRHQLNDCNFICTTIPTTQIKIDKCGRAIPENILKFENFERQLKVPFVVYADFESILKPIHTNEPDPIRSFTNKSFIHEPYSFSYRIRCSFDDSASKFVLYRGEDAAKVFVARLESDLRAIYYTYLNRIVPMKPLTASEENEFLIADSCGICEKPFELGDVKGIRGGISQCSERKHVANNRFLPDYDENEASSFITYLDATNLYGHSMSQPLPTDGFTWLSEQEILQLDIMGVPDDGPKGYVLEVDVHYPEELHDAHSDLPFLVESDDKRFIIPNTTKTLPWGHKDIEFYQTSPEVNFKFLIDALKTVPNHEADSDEKLDQLIRLLEEQSDD
ncbi:uncharacterized protein [Leptinotarsa decemlineata]|uniref:uncharacterized protein n=1 Tax=Leptinotarsa decemlineata TaxID=7539 RepID=UPI003D30D71D